MYNPTDTELWELVKQDNREAFELLYRRHMRALYATIYKGALSKADAEDILQEVFLDVGRYLFFFLFRYPDHSARQFQYKSICKRKAFFQSKGDRYEYLHIIHSRWSGDRCGNCFCLQGTFMMV